MFDPHGAVDLLERDPDNPTRAEIDQMLELTEAARSWITGREARWLRAGTEVEPDPADPAKDDADRLARKQKTSRAKAKTRTDTARELGNLPETQDALENGTITDAHADAMAHARSTADAQARAALNDHEADLLALGALESPWEFKQRLARFVKVHSADDGRSEWDRKQTEGRLRMWDDKDGMLQLHGQLPPGTPKAVLRRVLGGISDELFRRDHQDHPDDQAIPFAERDNEQRLAEALVEACRRAEGQAHPTTSHDRVVVTLTLQDLFGTPHDGPGPTMNDGTPVPASVARAMACEAGIIPLVLGGDSIPLDLGRTRRLASPGQRVALGALWSTCSFADCTTPYPAKIHHVRLDRAPPRQPVQRRRGPRQDQHRRAHPRLWALPRPRPSPRLALRQAPRRLHHHPRPRRHRMAPMARSATTSRAATGGRHPPRHPERAGRHPLHRRRLTTASARAPRRSRKSPRGHRCADPDAQAAR